MPAERHGKGLFVTGTDTGVGKTLVSAALTLLLRDRDLNVGVMKPVETGVAAPSRLGPDASLLQWAAGSEDPPELVSPYRFPLPLAPSDAAEEAGAAISFDRIISAATELEQQHQFLIIEGAGGLMVPMAGGLLVADLVRELGFPLLIVCRPDLGTLNHTLLTVFAARTMGLPLAGVIINNMPDHPDKAQGKAPHNLAALASADLLGVLGTKIGSDQEKTQSLAEQLSTLPTLPWLLAGLGIGPKRG